MIKTLLLASLTVMAFVITQQAYAYNAIESALKQQEFEKACMKEGNLSSVTSIMSLSRCPIAWNKFLNDTQQLNEANRK
jgi:hypothetical protein